MSKFEWLDKMREAGQVGRCHVVPTVGSQDVSQHCWNVAIIVWSIASNDTSEMGEPRPELLAYALLHDCAEVVTGDVPSPAKWMYPELEKALKSVESDFHKKWGLSELKAGLYPGEMSLVKFADMLEFMWLCIDQIKLGNRNYMAPFTRAATAIVTRNFPPYKGAKLLYRRLINEYERISPWGAYDPGVQEAVGGHS